jgi:hypothetical protein
LGKAFCVVIFYPFLKIAVSCKMTFTQNYLHPPELPGSKLLSFAYSKESNQSKRHPHAMTFGFPALLNKSGGCGTRFAQTVLAENS